MPIKSVSGNKDPLIENVRNTNILSLVVTVLIILLQVVVINHFLSRQNSDAKTINLAGRQRMLSQKIAKNLYAVEEDHRLTDLIKKDAEQWDSIHTALQNGSKALGIPKPINSTIIGLLDEISPYHEQLYQLATANNMTEIVRTRLTEIRDWEGKFLTGMDSLIYQYQKDAEKGTSKLEYSIYLFSIFFILILLGQYFVLVNPIIHSFRNVLDDREKKTQKLISILEATPDLIWSVDRDYNLLTFNSAFFKDMEEETGIVPSMGKSILNEGYSDKSLSRRKKLYNRAFSGERFTVESKISKNGQTLYHELSFNPIYDRKGLVNGCSVFRKDVTQKVEIIKKLRESEHDLKEAQKIANIGNWNWDMVQNDLKWSDQQYEVFGQDPKCFEANYEGLMSIVHPKDRQLFDNDIRESIANNRLQDMVHRIILPDGSIRFVHERGKVYYNKKKNPIRMTGTTQDVTLIEKAKQHILKQYKELQNFVYIISHNVRGPVSTLQGLVSIFEDGNDELNTEIIGRIQTTVDVLDGTIKDLNHALSLQKASDTSFEWIDLAQIVSDIEQLLAKDIATNKAKIESHFSMAPKAYGIKSYFTNIVYNLLLNSIKYKADTRAPHILISSGPMDGGGIRITVTDNGKGMELNDEKRKRIFDMYGRLSSDSGGKGLGLYLVKTQIETMKGSIEVQSEVDKGTVFTIVLEPVQ